MQHRKWLVALVAVALIAGCGSSSATTDTSASGGSSSSSSGGATAGDVYNACIDAISGTPAEATGQSACASAKSAFEQCASQAASLPGSEKDKTLKLCQDAADQAAAALKTAP